ncbi:MAG: DNA alkylation repair protein [Ignavibacteriales bacterium]|nr:DNA alkylation repair protein [Ignavibacteriales bacterium]
MTAAELIIELKKHYNQKNVDGMARFGIVSTNAFGISAPMIKSIAKKIGKNHELALELWNTGYYDARVIAFLIDDPKLVTKTQMNSWICDFDSWAICDGTCCYLFRKTPFAFEKILEWADRKEEFVRRTAFSLIAYIAVHDKKRDDKEFLQFFPLIKKYSVDERNFVKKAVNWALRQIGKRSNFLNKEALKLAKEIKTIDSKSARWIASDAIRELKNPKILARL